MMMAPQIGMVHPQPNNNMMMQHQTSGSSIYAPGSSATYAPGLERQRSYSNPRNLILI